MSTALKTVIRRQFPKSRFDESTFERPATSFDNPITWTS